jgi:RNA polymerase sigma-70 factor (ECF subfamily)
MSPDHKLSDPATWVDEHADYLYRYASLRIRDASVAEDLIQETLLAATGACERRDGRSSDRTWLVGILKQKVVDHLRQITKRRPFHFLNDEEPDDLDSFERNGEWVGHWREDQAPTDWNLNTSAILERKEFWEILDRCLSELPQRTAIAFSLREIDGLSSEEVCDVLNVSQDKLCVMLHRARMRLRNSLETDWFRNEPRGSETQPHAAARPNSSIESPGLQRALKLVGIGA